MPLAVLYGHIYKGKATAAAVDQVVNEEAVEAKQWSSTGVSDQITVLGESRATTLIGEAFSDQVVVSEEVSAKQWATAAAVDNIGASPSEYDIAQAVWLTRPSSVNYPDTMGEQAKKTKNDTGLIPGAL